MAYLIAAALFIGGYLAADASTFESVILLMTASLLVLMLTHQESAPSIDSLLENDIDI